MLWTCLFKLFTYTEFVRCAGIDLLQLTCTDGGGSQGFWLEILVTPVVCIAKLLQFIGFASFFQQDFVIEADVVVDVVTESTKRVLGELILPEVLGNAEVLG